MDRLSIKINEDLESMQIKSEHTLEIEETWKRIKDNPKLIAAEMVEWKNILGKTIGLIMNVLQ